jgi:hypothetical protein
VILSTNLLVLKDCLLDMSIRFNYCPSDLAYYTTWWLNSKPLISSQTTSILSVNNSIKIEDEYLSHQSVIIFLMIDFFFRSIFVIILEYSTRWITSKLLYTNQKISNETMIIIKIISIEVASIFDNDYAWMIFPLGFPVILKHMIPHLIGYNCSSDYLCHLRFDVVLKINESLTYSKSSSWILQIGCRFWLIWKIIKELLKVEIISVACSFLRNMMSCGPLAWTNGRTTIQW